jgi:sugar phosphate isomerase/epimerase
VFTAAGGGGAGAALRARGLACTDVGVLLLGGPEPRAAAGRLARLAEEAGATRCIAAVPRPVRRDEAVRELDAAAGILGRAGVRLALEFAVHGGLTRLEDAAALCDAVGWERCGLLLDSWHFFRTGAPWPLLRSLAGDRITLVHVNDGPRAAGPDPVLEGRGRRLPPGAGELPLTAFAAALDELGYGGPLSVEVLSDEVRLAPPRRGAQLLFDSLRETWPAAGYAAGATASGT